MQNKDVLVETFGHNLLRGSTMAGLWFCAIAPLRDPCLAHTGGAQGLFVQKVDNGESPAVSLNT